MPICVCLENKSCLVVGGGSVAERKVKNIVSSSPEITLVSPTITPYLFKLASLKKLNWEKREFCESDIDNKFIVFASTNDEDLNRKIAELCENKGVLVNVAKPGRYGNFIVPASIKKGSIAISISTSGEAPFFSALIKKDIQKRLFYYHKLFKILKPLRSHLLTKNDVQVYNNLMFKTFFNDNVFKNLEAGNLKAVQKIVKDFLSAISEEKE